MEVSFEDRGTVRGTNSTQRFPLAETPHISICTRLLFSFPSNRSLVDLLLIVSRGLQQMQVDLLDDWTKKAGLVCR